MSNPNVQHWMGIKRILRYLQGTIDYGLKFIGDNNSLVCYSDSDWAGDHVTRRSTSGYVSQFSRSTISWRSRRQATVAKSSSEAEYVALASATQEVIWLRRLFADLGLKLTDIPTVIFEDNQAAIELSKNPRHHNRMKHVDINYHFTRERVATGEVSVHYVPSTENIADIMTKGLSKGPFTKLRELIGVVKCPTAK